MKWVALARHSRLLFRGSEDGESDRRRLEAPVLIVEDVHDTSVVAIVGWLQNR
jgi:hypothetical protein